MTDYAIEGSDYERLQRENERLKAALRDIANANGDECHVLSNLRFIEGYHEGVQEQAKRARHALGEGAPPEYPANVLLALVERLKAERDLAVRVIGHLLTDTLETKHISDDAPDGEMYYRTTKMLVFRISDIRKVLAWYREAQNTEKGGG